MPQKIAVITGVSKGIGAALAHTFQQNGYSVIGISRSTPAHDHFDQWIEADLTKSEDITKITDTLKEKKLNVDVLINNAGRGHYETWEETEINDLKDMFQLNLFSMVELTQQLTPLLRETKGSIINISSVAGIMPIACMGGYCATKFAVNAFSHSLGIELHPQGINVLNVLVGRTSTGFSKGCTGTKRPPSTPGAADGPEKLSKAIFKACQQRKRELTFPRWYKFIFLGMRLFPSLYRHMNLKKWNLNN